MRALAAPLLALSAGAALPLAFAPFGWWPLALLAPALLFRLWREATPRRAAWLGWLFGLGQFGVGVSWVHHSIHQYGNAPLPLAIAMAGLLIAYLALFPALAGWLTRRLLPRCPTVPRTALLAPALWLLGEWLRGWLLTGFPWLNLGYSQIDTPLAGWAPLLGVYGLTLFTALSAGALAAAPAAGRRERLLLGALTAALWLGGAGLAQLEWTRPSGRPLKVTLIQGNVDQGEKWLLERRRATLDLYRELTGQSWESDLIVWPETAVPAFAHQVREYLERLDGEARSQRTALLVGAPYRDPDGHRYYNGLLALGDAEGAYYKRHLVPFGEYLPLRPALIWLLRWLEIPMSDFSSGDPEEMGITAAGHPLGASICFEAAFGEELIQALPRAELLVNVSNDAWFGDSLAPAQHLQIARMRALENGRWLVRATNDGISALIDPAGRVTAHTPRFVRTTLTGEVQPRSGSTPYAVAGNLAPLLLALGLLLWLRRRHRGGVVNSMESGKN